jgi:2,3-bisphosphoglycerate-independent phosphoglycerate mutase
MTETSENQNHNQARPKPVVLIIMDGWGVAQPYSGNAISQAKIPVFKSLASKYPTTTLRASGEAVGLPWGEAGNSEVGHLNLGLGRIVYQELPKINRAISDNSIRANKALVGAMSHARDNGGALHLMGLLSNGGVHSSIEHLYALLEMAKVEKINKLFVHVFLDGRDTQFNSGVNFVKDLQRNLSDFGSGKIATLCGRFYAMDRDNHWERIEKAYLAMVEGRGVESDDPIRAIEASYSNKIYDEEFAPTVITERGKPTGTIRDGDSLIFFNFRADRAREITKAFVLPGLSRFNRSVFLKDLYFVCMTEYEKKIPVEIAFPSAEYNDKLGEVLSRAGLKQLRIAETEKYAHVTYFFNGGREEKSLGEDQVLVPSPRIDSYAMKPEMSAPEVADKVVKAIESKAYDFILVNFANADMVGHTGDIKAAIRAVEFVDGAVGRVVESVLKEGGVAIITADHGNAEIMFNMQTGAVDKEHTANPVPFILVGKQYEGKSIIHPDIPGSDLSLIQPQGILSDVAPTILKIFGISQPEAMTGRSIT